MPRWWRVRVKDGSREWEDREREWDGEKLPRSRPQCGTSADWRSASKMHHSSLFRVLVYALPPSNLSPSRNPPHHTLRLHLQLSCSVERMESFHSHVHGLFFHSHAHWRASLIPRYSRLPLIISLSLCIFSFSSCNFSSLFSYRIYLSIAFFCPRSTFFGIIASSSALSATVTLRPRRTSLSLFLSISRSLSAVNSHFQRLRVGGIRDRVPVWYKCTRYLPTLFHPAWASSPVLFVSVATSGLN